MRITKAYVTLFEVASQWHGTLMIFSGYLALSIVGILVGVIAWRWLKNQLYLNFSIYALSLMGMALLGGFLVGHGPYSPAIANAYRLSILCAASVNLAYFFFMRSLIGPQEKMPKLYRAQIVVLILLTLTDVYALFRVDYFSWNLRGQFLLIYTIVNMIIQIRAAMSAPFIRWYVAGGIFFLIGNVPFVLLNAGAVTELTPFTGSLPFVGVLLETFCFLIGLVDRLRYEYLRNLNDSRVKMLGLAAAEIFHEIATPLTIISLSAHKLKKQSADAFDLAETIEKNAKRISANVDKFRTFSGVLDRGIRPSKFTAREIIDGASELFKRKVEGKGCQFILSDEVSSQVFIQGNKFDLEQLIANLVNNAADAIQKLEDKWIRLQTRLDGDMIEFKVIDSGRGIPKEIQDKIFNEFFTTKGLGEGSGLGLSICKRFAEAHGGYLKIDSKSVNTCFVLRLPVIKNQM